MMKTAAERGGRSSGMVVRRIMRYSAALLVALCAQSASCVDTCFYDDEGECNPSRECRGERIEAWRYDADHCGDDPCLVCPRPTHANQVPICNAQHSCAIQCQPLYGNCNGDPSDGCETPLFEDPLNCGACNVHCRYGCSGGLCEMRWEGESNVTALTAGNRDNTNRITVYWLASDGGSVDVRQGPTNGEEAITLASVPGTPAVPAAAGLTPIVGHLEDGMVFTDGAGGDGGVFRLWLLTRTVERIASGQDGPGSVIATPAGVYWTNYLGGQVMFAPRGWRRTRGRRVRAIPSSPAGLCRGARLLGR
jgi:hypothetical protein